MPAMSRIERAFCKTALWRGGTGQAVLGSIPVDRLGHDVLEIGSGSGDIAARLRESNPELAITATDFDPAMVRLLVAGRSAGAGALDDLTPREREVLAEMADAKSNAAIAEHLVLTKKAIEKHVGSIFSKLGLPEEQVVSRRVAAVLLYLAAERD